MTISGECDNISYSNNDLNNGNNINIPIVGYEIMEERARFTVSMKMYFIIAFNSLTPFFQLINILDLFVMSSF